MKLSVPERPRGLGRFDDLVALFHIVLVLLVLVFHLVPVRHVAFRSWEWLSGWIPVTAYLVP
jgi:hypothetical protein